jgi:hypothetical protein
MIICLFYIGSGLPQSVKIQYGMSSITVRCMGKRSTPMADDDLGFEVWAAA